MAITYKNQSALMTSNARKSNASLRPDGYIYIVRQRKSNFYKIGVSSNVERRVKDIDSHNPMGVDLIGKFFFKGVYNIEEWVHDCFAKCLLRREWFNLHNEDVKDLVSDLKQYSEEGMTLTRR